MLDYFKKNPAALLDAIPTPKNEEEGETLLKDFTTGLTPKKNFNFKFRDTSTSQNRPSTLQRRGRSNSIVSNMSNTPRR